MRILFLAPSYPYPTNNGTKRRIKAFLNYLANNHEVSLACLQEPLHETERQCNQTSWDEYIVDIKKSSLQAAIQSIITKWSYREVKFWNQELQVIIEDLLEKESYDAIWVNHLTMKNYIERWLSKEPEKAPLLLLDQHNVDELVWKSHVSNAGNIIRKMYSSLQSKKTKRLQKQWYPRFGVILSVSLEDLNATEEYVTEKTHLWLAPNGVDIKFFQPRPLLTENDRRPILVFGGAMDVIMNQDAARWFIKDIFPRIKACVPDVQFHIVGRDPPLGIRKLEEMPGVLVTGTVPDVREYYQHAAVFVIPSRFGGGTKIKTLEAMAMALPVVSTSIGAQGLMIENEKHLCLADQPERFANYVVELLNHRQKAETLGNNGRNLVAQHYNWGHIVSLVDDKLTKIISQKYSRMKGKH